VEGLMFDDLQGKYVYYVTRGYVDVFCVGWKYQVVGTTDE